MTIKNKSQGRHSSVGSEQVLFGVIFTTWSRQQSKRVRVDTVQLGNIPEQVSVAIKGPAK
jgi:hypothetical protein